MGIFGGKNDNGPEVITLRQDINFEMIQQYTIDRFLHRDPKSVISGENSNAVTCFGGKYWKAMEGMIVAVHQPDINYAQCADEVNKITDAVNQLRKTFNYGGTMTITQIFCLDKVTPAFIEMINAMADKPNIQSGFFSVNIGATFLNIGVDLSKKKAFIQPGKSIYYSNARKGALEFFDPLRG